MTPRNSLAGCFLLLVATGTGWAQESRVYKALGPAHLDKILKGLDIEFKKSALPGEGVHLLYTFERNKHKVILHNYDGKDLMLIAAFDGIPLREVNQWNQTAKFSKAVLNQEERPQTSTLEANLDLAGGVTDDTIKHFLRRFDDELKRYEVHVSRFLVQTEETYTALDTDRLEKLLSALKIQYKKTAGKNAGHIFYEFQKDGHKVRLHSFGGKDLMLAAAFKSAPLEKVNQYNSERKFVRAVLYEPVGRNAFTTLEANLDCQGGVTEGIVRFFIGTFEDEMREYGKYLNR